MASYVRRYDWRPQTWERGEAYVSGHDMLFPQHRGEAIECCRCERLHISVS